MMRMKHKSIVRAKALMSTIMMKAMIFDAILELSSPHLYRLDSEGEL